MARKGGERYDHVSLCKRVRMKRTKLDLGLKRPDIEVNKPSGTKFWRRPEVNLVLYLLFLAAIWSLWQSADRMAQVEISYSQFLQ